MEEEKHINKKKLIIAIIIAISIVILAIIAVFLVKRFQNDSNSPTLITKYSHNNSVSISFLNTLNLTDSEKQDNSLLINLTSPDDIYITSSQIPKILDKNLEELLLADKYSYINNYPNNFNVSEVYPIKINNYSSFAYNFYYKEEINNTFVDYFVTTVWIEKDSKVYILDIKLPANLLELYLEDLNNIIYSYTIY